jgi:hypothetical protein
MKIFVAIKLATFKNYVNVQLYILKKLVLPFFSRVDKRADIFVIP